jgi:hypothetical protein
VERRERTRREEGIGEDTRREKDENRSKETK